MIGGPDPSDMQLDVELVGAETYAVEVADDATVAALVEPLPVSIHEVSVVVDGRPRPADAPVPTDADSIRVVRLVKGG
jgi:sulfur carrier protein ThiS